GRRGYMEWTVRVEGTPAHSAEIFRDESGYGAALEAARVLDGFRTRLAGEANLTFNPALALGGTQDDPDAAAARGGPFDKANGTPERAVEAGARRALTPEQLARTGKVREEVVAASLPGTSRAISFEEGYPPLAPTDGNRRLLALYDQISRDLGA